MNNKGSDKFSRPNLGFVDFGLLAIGALIVTAVVVPLLSSRVVNKRVTVQERAEEQKKWDCKEEKFWNLKNSPDKDSNGFCDGSYVSMNQYCDLRSSDPSYKYSSDGRFYTCPDPATNPGPDACKICSRLTCGVSPSCNHSPGSTGSSYNGVVLASDTGDKRWSAGTASCTEKKGVTIATSGYGAGITWQTDGQGGHFDAFAVPTGNVTTTLTLPSASCNYTCDKTSWEVRDNASPQKVYEKGTGCVATFNFPGGKYSRNVVFKMGSNLREWGESCTDNVQCKPANWTGCGAMGTVPPYGYCNGTICADVICDVPDCQEEDQVISDVRRTCKLGSHTNVPAGSHLCCPGSETNCDIYCAARTTPTPTPTGVANPVAKSCSITYNQTSKLFRVTGTGDVGNQVRLWVEKKPDYSRITFPGTMNPNVQEITVDGKYYYQIASCSIGTGGTACNAYQDTPINFPTGDYAYHCDIPQEPGKCSGAPWCTSYATGGNCAGWQACSTASNRTDRGEFNVGGTVATPTATGTQPLCPRGEFGNLDCGKTSTCENKVANGGGNINTDDLQIILNRWGSNGVIASGQPGYGCWRSADITAGYQNRSKDKVDIDDLQLVLSKWGN